MEIDPLENAEPAAEEQGISAEVQVGRKLRELRMQRGLSLRALADISGLNINTLSLIENGKSSPSVSTLQQLAQALNIPIAHFFASDPISRKVVFTPGDRRPKAVFGDTQMQNLGKDLNGNSVQPFVVELQPGADSGDQRIVHTGYEFVYCLDGTVSYEVDNVGYTMRPGDSLVFEAHLPHCWKNNGENIARIILILCPADEREKPGERHFANNHAKSRRQR